MTQGPTSPVTSSYDPQSESVSSTVPTPRRGAILVVEDRDDVRQGLAQLLEMHGFLVCDAATAEEAIGHLAADPEGIALILLDLMLAGSAGGREVRARQLADARLAAIPTIVATASEADLRARAQLQPAAWLEKPFRFDDLLDLVKQYVTPERGAMIDC